MKTLLHTFDEATLWAIAEKVKGDLTGLSHSDLAPIALDVVAVSLRKDARDLTAVVDPSTMAMHVYEDDDATPALMFDANGKPVRKMPPVAQTTQVTTTVTTAITPAVQQTKTTQENPVTGAPYEVYTDLHLHGFRLTLLGVKQVLRDVGVRQADIATQAGITTSDLSDMLLGKAPVSPEVVLVLERSIDASAVMRRAAPAATQSAVQSARAPIASAAAQPDPNVQAAAQAVAAKVQSTLTKPGKYVTAKMPSFAKTLASIPDDVEVTVMPDTAAQRPMPAAQSLVKPFPRAEAIKLAGLARKAKDVERRITATFSSRKLVNWQRAYRVLQAEGFSRTEALAGAFHLAAESRETGESQRFLKEVFNSLFACESRLPDIPARTAITDGNRHPASFVLRPLIQHGFNVWLYGPTGTWKTTTVIKECRALGKEPIRIQGSGDATVDDLVGGWGVVRDDHGTPVTVFQHGPLAVAAKEGRPVVVDEVTAYSQDVLFVMQAVLEGNPLVITKNRGEVIVPAPGFCILATDNTVGTGEGIEYIGTGAINEATRDRFVFLRFDYPSEAQEMQMLADDDTTFTAAWQLPAA